MIRVIGLDEPGTVSYRVRVRVNVSQADVTVWFGDATLAAGAALTRRACADYGKPLLENPSVDEFVDWCSRWRPQVIHVTGIPQELTQHRACTLKPALLRYTAFLTHPKPIDSTPVEEQDEKDDAVESVDENTNAQWREFALAAVYAVAQQRAELITEDVWRHMQTQVDSASVHDHRAMGPIMNAAAKQGWVERLPQTRNAEQMAHKRPMRVWRSLLWRS